MNNPTKNIFNSTDLQPFKSLYIHIPFCSRRCNYCDFYSSTPGFESNIIDSYVENLIICMRNFLKSDICSDIEYIYIGGGTPSFIGAKRLVSLLYVISLSTNLAQIKEFSMEANPESINKGLIKDIYALGVNRLSIGVQSLDDKVLQTLGRAHNSLEAIEAIKCAQERFDNINADVMCGIPGQSVSSLKCTLSTLIDLEVKHISVYPLSVEKNTPIYKSIEQGKISSVNNDIQAIHMECASKILKQAGFVHYEISNYSLPGYECKHNLNYWKSVPYLGIGDSAVSMAQTDCARMRFKFDIDPLNNFESLIKCLSIDNTYNCDYFKQEDLLNKKEMICEDLILLCRTNIGITKGQYSKAKSIVPNIDKTFTKLVELGLLNEFQNSNIKFKPSKLGWMCGNDLFGAIYSL